MLHRRDFLFGLALVSATLTMWGQAPFALHDGTPIRLRLNRNISSADATIGETVDFEVLEDVKVNDVVELVDGKWIVKEADTERRRKEIKALMDSVWED